MRSNEFTPFQAPHLHVEQIEQPTAYYQQNESQTLELNNWYHDINPTTVSINQLRSTEFDSLRPPHQQGHQHGHQHGHQQGHQHGHQHGYPPYGPPPHGHQHGHPPYGPPPHGYPPYGPPIFPPFGPYGPLGPFGPLIPIPIPIGVPRPAQPELIGKNVYVVVQGGNVYPNATATYQIQYVPGITVYQALLSTGNIQLADNGQILAVSGVTINDDVKYALSINGQPVYITMLNNPLAINDVVTLTLVYP